MTKPEARPGGDSTFERFERFTRQLLTVPKKELDARIEQAKRGSKRRRPSH
jgi:hypothetical protein